MAFHSFSLVTTEEEPKRIGPTAKAIAHGECAFAATQHLVLPFKVDPEMPQVRACFVYRPTVSRRRTWFVQ